MANPFLEVACMSKPGQMVLVALRKMIASGELAAGERLMEIPTAERFGVSRMPVRMAFVTLEQEGLLVRHGGRGYQVRSVSADDIAGAVEVRGVLEGLAARQSAERGLSEEAQAALRECLVQGDALFDKGFVTEEDLQAALADPEQLLSLRLHVHPSVQVIDGGRSAQVVGADLKHVRLQVLHVGAQCRIANETG